MEMLYQGSGESGIGVQTAIQQCQPADGGLGAHVGPLVSHRGEGSERRRGAERFFFLFKRVETLQSLESSL